MEYDSTTVAVAINLIEFQNLNFLYPKNEALFSREFPRYLVTGYEFNFDTWRLLMIKTLSANYSTHLLSEAWQVADILCLGNCDRRIRSFQHLAALLYQNNLFPACTAINSKCPFTEELMARNWRKSISLATTGTHPMLCFKQCVSLQNGVHPTTRKKMRLRGPEDSSRANKDWGVERQVWCNSKVWCLNMWSKDVLKTNLKTATVNHL